MARIATTPWSPLAENVFAEMLGWAKSDNPFVQWFQKNSPMTWQKLLCQTTTEIAFHNDVRPGDKPCAAPGSWIPGKKELGTVLDLYPQNCRALNGSSSIQTDNLLSRYWAHEDSGHVSLAAAGLEACGKFGEDEASKVDYAFTASLNVGLTTPVPYLGFHAESLPDCRNGYNPLTGETSP